MTRSITILGATGSIGTSTLDLIEREPDKFQIDTLTAHRDVQGLASAALRTRASLAVIGDESLYDALKSALSGSGIEIAAGATALVEAASRPVDWTMAAIVGAAGLPPVMAAVQRGGTLALANKEALVCAGELVQAAVKAHDATLLPVDSEHNAIFQCFDVVQAHRISRIILTASGGPFRGRDRAAMAAVTPAEAVRHPNWSMGAKISVDSATLMNKGLELIEAQHIFGLEPDKFEVIIHPQSVIHSMVEYVDGSVLAQMGSPDMRIPIGFCLGWPERMTTPAERLDLARIAQLDFHAPDLASFPALALAMQAMKEGGARPAILNAANEVAVAAFLEHRIGFLAIAEIVADVLARYAPPRPDTLEDVFAVDAETRRIAAERVEAIPA
ncbi:1-deoxy-D-xylulose-5-phosphate reductoisomerase [Aquisediminimonas sediminicola]|uniref:1-deoxy-D-xylulose-5-phosphate reductoisomerase n=1 Tax=Alteraquisediminimonas sediminicola TaxID=2676787 RepID=UPI0031B83BC7